MTEVNFNFYQTVRKLSQQTSILEIMSVPEPVNFTFRILHIKNLAQILNPKILCIQISVDYLQFSVVPSLKLNRIVKYFYTSYFHQRHYCICYTLVDKIISSNMEVSNFQLLLISQMLRNDFRTKDAPFQAQKSTHKFTDRKGAYNNKYQTYNTTKSSIKALDPIFPKDFKFTDYHPLDFSYETHPHLFLRPINKIGWHNVKFGTWTLEAPHACFSLCIYIIIQFNFFQVPQHLLTSKTIFLQLFRAKVLPTNTTIISFSPNLGFIFEGVPLKSSPKGQILLCFGYSQHQMQATVHSDFSFSTPQTLIRLKLPSSKPQHSQIQQILSRFRNFEKQLNYEQNKTPHEQFNFHNHHFDFLYEPVEPNPDRTWAKLQPYHHKLDPLILLNHDVHYQNVTKRRHTDTRKIIIDKPNMINRRISDQADAHCQHCGDHHFTFACITNPKNYHLTSAFQKALYDTYLHLPSQEPIFLEKVSAASFKTMHLTYKIRIKHFWKIFHSRNPAYIDNHPRELCYLDNYSRCGLLWATGAKAWLFKFNLTGIFIPFNRKPNFFYVHSSFDASSEEEAFLLKWINFNVPRNIMVPFPKKKLKGISQVFVVNLKKNDMTQRPRAVVAYDYINQFISYAKYGLPTSRETFYEMQGRYYVSFPIDIAKAYYLILLSKLDIPWSGIAVKIGGHTYFFVFLVAPFGFSSLCLQFNRYTRPSVKPLISLRIFLKTYFDNLLAALRRKDYPPPLLALLGEFLGWYFRELNWKLNPDYPANFTSQFSFIGTHLNLHTETLQLTLKRFYKIQHLLHIIFAKCNISPHQASKFAGTLQSLANFNNFNIVAARYFYNFISDKMGTWDWKHAQKICRKEWNTFHPLPPDIYAILDAFSKHLAETQQYESVMKYQVTTTIHIFSDANPNIGYANIFVNNVSLFEHLSLIPPSNEHSHEFELFSIFATIEFFLSQLTKFSGKNTLLVIHCDNVGVVEHCRSGARQDSQNNVVLNIFEMLLPLNFRFEFHWANRDTIQMSRTDARGRVPLPECFTTPAFRQYLKYHYGNDFFFFTPSMATLRQLRTASYQFWNSIAHAKVPIILGPLYDNKLLNSLIPKLALLHSNILLIVPEFQNQFYWSFLQQNANLRKIPFKFTQFSRSACCFNWKLHLAHLNRK